MCHRARPATMDDMTITLLFTIAAMIIMALMAASSVAADL